MTKPRRKPESPAQSGEDLERPEETSSQLPPHLSNRGLEVAVEKGLSLLTENEGRERKGRKSAACQRVILATIKLHVRL